MLWRWGIDGHKSFNNKNFHYLLDEMIGSIEGILPETNQRQHFEEKINELDKKRNDAEKYENNILNFNYDLAPAQEKLAKSKIYEINAKNNFKNMKIGEANQLLAKSEDEILNSIGKLQTKTNYENRGIWFDRGSIVNIKSQDEMGKIFDRLKNCHITLFIL